MSYYVGLDMGSSSVKLILLSENGEVLRKHAVEYTVLQPHSGWREIAPEIWYHAAMNGLAWLLKDFDASLVAGIGITGQMHSTVFLDAAGESIRPAILWDDTRTRALLPTLRSLAMQNKELSYLSGILSTGSPAANLYWLMKEEPQNFNRLHCFLIGPDYLVYRLTGNCQTDYCEASTSALFDMRLRAWSQEVQKALGFPSHIYPPVRGSACIAGLLLPQVADRFGLRHDTKVIVGTGDNPATALSTGCLENDSCTLSLGTSGVLMYVRPDLNFSACGKNILFSMDGKEFHVLVQGVLQSCGNSLNWWTKDILHLDDFSLMQKQTFDARMDKNELLFYPHLTGDKTLYNDPSLQGAFLGLRTDVTRADMTYAILEGTAFGIRQLFEEMRVDISHISELAVIGGGTSSDVWMQILANVLHLTTVRLGHGQSSVHGIALLAAHACGDCLEYAQTCCGGGTPDRRFEPQLDRLQSCDAKYARYLRIHDSLKHIYAD